MSDIGSSTRVFFNASCLIVAAAAPNGGSGFLWSLCERGFLQAVVSEAVLTETETNLGATFPSGVLARHQQQLDAVAPLIAAIPRLDVDPRRYPGINAKDEHVIAVAIASSAPIVITLDRPLEAEINAVQVSVRAMSPGTYITTVLPLHPWLASMRDGEGDE